MSNVQNWSCNLRILALLRRHVRSCSGKRASHKEDNRNQDDGNDGENKKHIKGGQATATVGGANPLGFAAPFVSQRLGHRFAEEKKAELDRDMNLPMDLAGPDFRRDVNCEIGRVVPGESAASEVPTLPPSLRRSASRPTAAPRNCGGMLIKEATFSGAKVAERPAMKTSRGQTTCQGPISTFRRDIQ